jgi:hypothetical protein
MLVDELLTYLFSGQPHLLAEPMAAWLASSRRFTAFVTTFRDKIRKKLNVTQELESLLDLRLELETAYLLLQERSFSLVYEPPPSGKLRHPDFAVTFTTSTLFMIEVTRLRALPDGTPGLAHAQESALPSPAASTHSPMGDRLTDMVCSKLGQLLPGRTNILLVGMDASYLNQDALRAEMLRLQQRAERNEAAVVQGHRFRDRADFFQHYQRLSELLVRVPQLQAGEPVITWVNPQAKYPLPGRVRTALYRSQST